MERVQFQQEQVRCSCSEMWPITNLCSEDALGAERPRTKGSVHPSMSPHTAYSCPWDYVVIDG